MGITGSFSRGRAQARPMEAKPAPEQRHGKKVLEDGPYAAPPAGTGQGAPFAEAVQPTMNARGVVLDLGHRHGHAGTPATRAARRPFTVSRFLGQRQDAAAVERDQAQAAASTAHGDAATAYLSGHQYAPAPQAFAGEAYEVCPNNVAASPSVGARTIAHGRPGGQHTDGGSGEFAPTGYNQGIGTAAMPRWAAARYSSPTLGAMYSKNTARGVLMQQHTVPVNQAADQGGAAGTTSGMPSNQRFKLPMFTTPALYRSPVSMSEAVMADNPAPETLAAPTMGVGF